MYIATKGYNNYTMEILEKKDYTKHFKNSIFKVVNFNENSCTIRYDISDKEYKEIYISTYTNTVHFSHKPPFLLGFGITMYRITRKIDFYSNMSKIFEHLPTTEKEFDKIIDDFRFEPLGDKSISDLSFA